MCFNYYSYSVYFIYCFFRVFLTTLRPFKVVQKNFINFFNSSEIHTLLIIFRSAIISITFGSNVTSAGSSSLLSLLLLDCCDLFLTQWRLDSTLPQLIVWDASSLMLRSPPSESIEVARWICSGEFVVVISWIWSGEFVSLVKSSSSSRRAELGLW